MALLCGKGFFHAAPSNPWENAHLRMAAERDAINDPIFVGLKYDPKGVVCECDAGCWYFSDMSDVTRVPLTHRSMCVLPYLEDEKTNFERQVVTDGTDVTTDDTESGSDNLIDPIIISRDDLTNGEKAAIIIACSFALLVLLVALFSFLFKGESGGDSWGGSAPSAEPEEEETGPSYKQGRGAVVANSTAVPTNREFPDTAVDLEGQVDMMLESEKTPGVGKRKIGALEVSSNSVRDYRTNAK